MLTFEEFFQKKKIDLAALQAGQPALYGEFLKHYAAMGEKSFDHSKKFWFNKLRKEYLLDAGKPAVVPEKPLPVSDESLTPESPVMPADATGTDKVSNTISAKPTGFKPRFKAGAVKGDHAAKTVTTEDAKTEDARPIPSSDDELSGPTKESSSVPSAETTKEERSPSAVNKPAGFKPRFKPGVTKAKAATDSSVGEKPSAVQTKESATAPGSDEPTAAIEGKSTTSIPAEEQPLTSPSAETTKEENSSSAPNKPAGFKPRFKPGVTKSKAAADPSASEKSSRVQTKESANAPASDEPTADEPTAPIEGKPTTSIPQGEETSSATASPESTKEEAPSTSLNKPTGFKPRFKAGVTKPSKPKDDQ